MEPIKEEPEEEEKEAMEDSRQVNLAKLFFRLGQVYLNMSLNGLRV